MNEEKSNTIKFSIPSDKKTAKEVLMIVYQSLKHKGYDPISQIVGYMMSGDPTYVTSYNDARFLITKIERDELLEELLRFYVENNDKDGENE